MQSKSQWRAAGAQPRLGAAATGIRCPLGRVSRQTPQAAQIAAPGLSRSYKTRVAGTHADLSISLTPQYEQFGWVGLGSQAQGQQADAGAGAGAGAAASRFRVNEVTAK